MASGTATPPPQGFMESCKQFYDNGGAIGWLAENGGPVAKAAGNTCGEAWKSLMLAFK